MTAAETEELLKTRRKTDDNYVIVEECLKEIKKDIRTLPCKNVGEGCLQEKPLLDLTNKIEKIADTQSLCFVENISPLIAANALLGQKLDQSQKTLENICVAIGKTNEIVAANNLATTNAITAITTNRDVTMNTKIQIRTVIAWVAGLIISTITIFTFLKNFVL